MLDNNVERAASSHDVMVRPFSHHRNGDASHIDRDPYTQLGAAKHQGNPIRVSQPCDAYSSRDGTPAPTAI